MTTEAKIRVLIVDDHPVVRDGLAAMLQSYPDFDVVGEASDGQEAVTKASALEPDVVLLDVRMPVLDGIEAMRRIRAQRAATHVVILTTFQDYEIAMEALEGGADGFLLKDATRDELVRAIQAVHAGESFIQPKAASQAMERAAQQAAQQAAAGLLSARELEVLKLIARGAANKEVAEALGISPSTVKTYVERIFHKLEVTARTEAVTKALERRLINL